MKWKFDTHPEVLALVAGAEIVLPPSTRNQWTRSRIVLLPEGPVPLLSLIAMNKFGKWDAAEQFPYWKDKNWTNESPDNAAMTETDRMFNRRVKVSQFGIPAGTAEYARLYREKHRERINNYQKTRYKAMNEARKKYASGELTVRSHIPEPLTQRLASSLDDIINMAKGIKTGQESASGFPDATPLISPEK